jgi:hypothetical protein
MMKKVIVVVIALAIGVGVAFLVESSVRSSAFRFATTGRDLCYAQAGYEIGAAPDQVRTACDRPMFEYSEGETMRNVKAGAAGVAAAGLILLLAWFLMFRRRESAGSPPPAG